MVYALRPAVRYDALTGKLMESAKDEVRALLDRLPANATLEDIHYGLYVRVKIRRGLRDVEQGRTVSHEQAEKRMKRWLKRLRHLP